VPHRWNLPLTFWEQEEQEEQGKMGKMGEMGEIGEMGKIGEIGRLTQNYTFPVPCDTPSEAEVFPAS
jgi:hypothetical protein